MHFSTSTPGRYAPGGLTEQGSMPCAYAGLASRMDQSASGKRPVNDGSRKSGAARARSDADPLLRGRELVVDLGPGTRRAARATLEVSKLGFEIIAPAPCAFSERFFDLGHGLSLCFATFDLLFHPAKVVEGAAAAFGPEAFGAGS